VFAQTGRKAALASTPGGSTRYVTVGVLTPRDPAGASSTVFSGRIGRRALPPGSYVAILTASNAAGRSQSKRLAFRIVRA
jgi:hypothetical protein